MNAPRKRVGVVALLQESNTFIGRRTCLDDFRRDTLVSGDEMVARFAEAPHEVGGFFEGLQRAGIEAVPMLAARAMPFGPMTTETHAALFERLDAAMSAAGHLDGLLLAPHGATVSQQEVDFDGAWITHLRDRYGSIPIIGTLDLHGNVSRRVATACDALFAYRTNPHLDQRAAGIAAAELMARTLRGEVRPTQAAEFIPLVINIERQSTAAEPCRSLYAAADELRRQPGILAVSLLLGFPYADVPQVGAVVLVTTDNDPARAPAEAAKLAALWWSERDSFRGHLIDPDEALRMAAEGPWPVGLLDMGDNVGGGSPGDGTVLAEALERHKLGPAFACLCDPAAVAQCQAAGVGKRLSLSAGACVDRLHGQPLNVEVTVRGLHEGRFRETETRHGGFVEFDQGPTAVVETDAGLTLMLTSERVAPFSIKQLTSFGIDPAAMRYIVIKGVHAPVAAYAPVCKRLIRVNTPGVTTADLSQLTFHHRRRPMFPFERDTAWQPEGTR